jgi:hypothetical protein
MPSSYACYIPVQLHVMQNLQRPQMEKGGELKVPVLPALP